MNLAPHRFTPTSVFVFGTARKTLPSYFSHTRDQHAVGTQHNETSAQRHAICVTRRLFLSEPSMGRTQFFSKATSMQYSRPVSSILSYVTYAVLFASLGFSGCSAQTSEPVSEQKATGGNRSVSWGNAVNAADQLRPFLEQVDEATYANSSAVTSGTISYGDQHTTFTKLLQLHSELAAPAEPLIADRQPRRALSWAQVIQPSSGSDLLAVTQRYLLDETDTSMQSGTIADVILLLAPGLAPKVVVGVLSWRNVDLNALDWNDEATISSASNRFTHDLFVVDTETKTVHPTAATARGGLCTAVYTAGFTFAAATLGLGIPVALAGFGLGLVVGVVKCTNAGVPL